MKVSKKVRKKQSYKEWQEGKQARNEDIMPESNQESKQEYRPEESMKDTL